MTDHAEPDAPSLATNILVLEAFEHVHTDKVEDYERMGSAIDDLVKATEPGMLVHALTKVSKTDQEVVYRWLEVFDSEMALEKHVSNPHVIAHIAAMNQGVLAGETELVIYCDWDDNQKAYWNKKVSGAKLTFAPMLSGFFLAR